jgi:REP element-mobilizing transposase RayT
MSHSFAAVWLHIVFGTKNRLPFLNDAIRPELHAYVATVLKNLDCPALLINSVDDHLHALARLSRRHAIERVLEGMKANSSRWLKTKGGPLRLFHWQAGYGAFSVSPSQVETVQRYIARQAEHHRRITFQEEFEELLRRHGCPFDPASLWRVEPD